MRGLDILTAQDAGLRGATDPEQLSFAAANGRVMVSYDTDFLVLDKNNHEHAGIVWCRSTKYSIGEIIQALVYVHSVLTPDDMRNHVEYL